MFRGFFLILLNLALMSSISASTLSQSQPTLIPPDKQYRQATDPVRILFPAMSQHITSGTSLALEMDAIDVSELVAIEGDELIFTPLMPLPFGKHELRLVEYAENGDIIELGNWVFDIRQSAAFREQQLSVNAALNNAYRIADDYTDEASETDKYYGDGAVAIDYVATNENSGVNFIADLLYQEDEEDAATGKQLDLGQYLLGIDIGENTHVDIGHHAVQHSSLIYHQFHRRGISGQFLLPSINSKLQLFSARAGDLQGFTQGFGVEDSNNRLSGLVFDYQPFTSNPELLTVSTSYLTGKRQDNDSTMGMLVEESEGDANSIAFDSQLFGQSLRIRAEAAQTRFDFDGSQGFDKEKDTAYQFFTAYTPQPIDGSETPMIWDIQLEKTVVEPDFYSLANTGLVPDKDFTQVSTNISRAAWSTQFFVNHEEDNLDDRFAATNNVDQAGTVIRYSSATENDQSFWGVPQYTLSYIHTKNDQDTDNVATTNDNKIEYLELLNEFSYEKGHWLLLLSEDKYTDSLSPELNTTTYRYETGGEYTIHSSSVAMASVSYEDTEEKSTQQHSELINYLLGINYAFATHAIHGTFSVNYQTLDDEISDEESDSLIISTSITKQMRKAKDLFPGIDVALSGNYQKLDDRTDSNLDQDNYAVFLNLNFYWDVNRPRLAEGE